MQTSARLLVAFSVACAAVPICLGEAHAQNQLSVTITSGQIYNAAKTAFIEPFERETGIKVVSQALDPPDAIVRLKAMHDSGTVTVDVLALETRHMIVAGRDGLLEP